MTLSVLENSPELVKHKKIVGRKTKKVPTIHIPLRKVV